MIAKDARHGNAAVRTVELNVTLACSEIDIPITERNTDVTLTTWAGFKLRYIHGSSDLTLMLVLFLNGLNRETCTYYGELKLIITYVIL